MTDTTPDKVDPTTVEGYEPPIDGESTKERRARKARNRRRAEKVQREQAAAVGAATGTKPVGRPSAASKREQSVTGILTGVGIGVMAFDEFDGTTIIEGAPDLGKALANVAERNPKVAKALDSLTETSAWAEVAVAVAGIALPIVRHHAEIRAERNAEAEAEQVSAGADTTPKPTPPTSTPEASPPPQASPDAPVFTIPQSDDAPDPVPTFRARG